MVTFTDSQVGEMLARLIRIQESATAIDEERLYWKGVAEKLHETVDERERMTLSLLADVTDALTAARKECDRLRALWENEVINADAIAQERNREIAYLQAAARSDLSLLRDLHAMKRDYENHRGRFGGTGVGAEIDSILNGDGYAQVTAKEQVMTTKELDTFEDLLGKTLSAVEVNSTMDELVFTLDNGEQYMLYHKQDCCEAVSIEDICGDLSDLVGSPILMAEEASNSDDPKPDDWDDSWTWTFYKLATLKGYVTIRWYGSSNGYYSERVDWCKV